MRKQSLSKFLNNAIETSNKKPSLSFINKENDNTVGCDGYRMHIDYNKNQYNKGLNHTNVTIDNDYDKSKCKYPDFQAIIKPLPDKYFTLDSKELLYFLKDVKTYMKACNYFIDVSYENGYFRISGTDKETKEELFSGLVKCYNISPIVEEHFVNFTINYKYLKDAVGGLKHMKDIYFYNWSKYSDVWKSYTNIIRLGNTSDRLCVIMGCN